VTLLYATGNRTYGYCYMRLVHALWLAAACSPPPPTVPIANHPATGAKPPACPSNLEALVRARWHQLEDATDLKLQCEPGNFGAPGWFVTATYFAEHSIFASSGILAANAGTDLVDPTIDEVAFGTPLDRQFTYRAADLDGDGVDEIVKQSVDSRQSDFALQVNVVRVKDGAMVEIQGPFVNADDAGPDGIRFWCDARLAAVTGRRIMTTITSRRGEPQCPVRGNHVFELRGEELVEIHH
jgi:hypothetical protein